MDKLLEIIVPVVIVLFIAGAKLFAVLKEKGVDFGSLLQGGENTPDYPPHKAITRQEYNEEDEWGAEVIIVPPAHEADKRAPLIPEKTFEFAVPENMKAAVKKTAKSAPQALIAAEEDEHHPSRSSRGEYYSEFIHAHGKSAILIHEILSKPKGLE
jgi:hypothetical protein